MRVRPAAIVIGACALAAALIAGLSVRDAGRVSAAAGPAADYAPGASHERLPLGSFRHPPNQPGEPDASNVIHSFRVELAELLSRLDADPSDTAALAETAMLLHAAHEAERAIEYYERYVAEGGGRRDVLLGMAGACAESERWDGAERAMVALIERDPADAEAMYNLGAIHANQGDYEGARTWWVRVRDDGGESGLAAKASSSLARLSRTGS